MSSDAKVLNDNCVSDCLAAMALTADDSRLHTPQTSSARQLLSTLGFCDFLEHPKTKWDLDVFVATVRLRSPNLDWSNVIRNLDRPNFRLNSLLGLELIVDVFRKGSQQKKKFPVHLLFKEWENPLSQYSMLANLVSAPPEVFNFADYTGTEVRKILTPEELPIVSPTNQIVTLPNQALNCLDVFSTFVLLQKHASCRPDISQFLLNASVQAPELTLLGLIQLPEPWSENHAERVSTLTKNFTMGLWPSAPFMLQKLWSLQEGQKHLLSAFLELYNVHAIDVPQIFSLLQDLDGLEIALRVSDLLFCIDLAVFASESGYLDLSLWLEENNSDKRISQAQNNHQNATEHINSDKYTSPEYIRTIEEASMVYLREKLSSHVHSSFVISSSSISILCGFLQARFGGVVPGDIAFITEMHSKNQNEEANNVSGSFAKVTLAVEKESILLLENLLMNRIPIEEFITHIGNLKRSTNNEDNMVFSCVVNTFIDEARFIASYPDNNLVTAATVMGVLVEGDIMDQDDVRRMMNLLRDTLLTPPDDPKFLHFALIVVSRFLGLIPKYREFFQNLITIPSVIKHAPELATLVRESAPKKNFTAIDPGEDLKFNEPPNNVQEKIFFLINNLSPANISQKQREVTEILSAQEFRWFSYYMVNKRVAIEPNFHVMYLLFVEEFQNYEFYKWLLDHSFQLAESILNMETEDPSDSDRGRLKNIGSWLGGLTISRNKPILQKKLNFKRLLLEAYESNRLKLAIPFVCKVFEHAKDSIIFLPPNPWVTGIFSLLVEIYHHADMKLTLKFEIEVLLKNLGIEFIKIKPSSILSLTKRGTESFKPKSIIMQVGASRRENPNLQESKEEVIRINQVQAQMIQKSERIHQFLNETPVLERREQEESSVITLGAQFAMLDPINARLTEIQSNLRFNSTLRVFESNPEFKEIISEAFSKAFSEIMTQVVERSVSIAVISARDLLLKDFCLEPDAQKLMSSAHAFGILLAGTLAQLTCKEPLSVIISGALRTVFPMGNSQQVIDHTIRVLVEENIDLCVNLIVQSANERVVQEIDEQLTESYLIRQQAQEQGYFFTSISQEQSLKMQMMPENLRMLPGGLSQNQLAIYKNHEFIGDKGYPVDKSIEGFNLLLLSLERNIICLGQSKEVPNLHEVRDLIRQAPQYLPNGNTRDKVAASFCSKLIRLLFLEEISKVGREIYAVTLREICGQSTIIMHEVKEWILFSTEDRRLNVGAICATIKAGIIRVNELDPQLARLSISNERITEFSAELIRTSILQGITQEQEWLYTIDVINRAIYWPKTSDKVKILVEYIRKRTDLVENEEDFNIIKNRMGLTFAEWVRMCQNVKPSEEIIQGIIKELKRIKIFKEEKKFCIFYRVCVEISIDAWKKVNMKASSPVLAYHAIDSLAKLAIIHAISIKGKEVEIIGKVLSIIVLILVQNHESSINIFNQRPYYRIITSIIFEVQSNYKELEEQIPEIYRSISMTLHSLQPVFLPSFAFSWLHLISNTYFISQVLSKDINGSWAGYAKLIINLFGIIRPFLLPFNNANEGGAKKLLLGTFRLMIVLFHDFADFLCTYSFVLCSAIPIGCTQLRNIILGAYPSGMKLPELQGRTEVGFEVLLTTEEEPKVNLDAMRIIIKKSGIERIEINTVLLKIKLVDPIKETEEYKIDLIHAIVAKCGYQDLDQSNNKFYQTLINQLDSEGRYYVLTGIANQLRYPSTHTRYFINIILWLFQQEESEKGIREQITRVLLERLIINPPHQWGVRLAFLEILRNPSYKFWDNKFTRCSKDVEKLFQSVAATI